ncbi:MAG: UbiA family prenyltransferase [Gemmataceae bacterium]
MDLVTGRTLAFAQLIRLPNVFTAFSDILVGACAVGSVGEGPLLPRLFLLLTASGLLYLSGMAWNDYFDRAEDAKTRPNRPIPSGRITPAKARIIALLLMFAGVLAAGLATSLGEAPLLSASSRNIAIALAGAILLYDRILKLTPIGPVGMGTCRFLNVLLGFSLAGNVFDSIPLLVAAIVGLYIVGVTWFARTEEGTSRSSHLMGAAGIMSAALVLALALPVWYPPGHVTPLYPYLLIAFAVWIGIPIGRAIRESNSKHVQIAVKRCILGLVLLDAVLATLFVGPVGLFIGLLLIPAQWLGKWVYST